MPFIVRVPGGASVSFGETWTEPGRSGSHSPTQFVSPETLPRRLTGGERFRSAEILKNRIPAPAALAKLAEWGNNAKTWEDEPRIPEGQTGGGRWTREGGAAGPVAPISPPTPAPRPKPAPQLDDGVYRPATDGARVVPAGGAEEAEPSRRSNGPPDDYTRLEDVFPGLRDKPAAAVPLAPVDGFFGFSATSDAAHFEATLGQYWALVADIKRIDPTFVYHELLPSGGIEALSWQGRTNLINNLRMQRAVAYYRLRGDIAPLQVETLRFLQGAVDAAYEEAVAAADGGRLQPRLSRAEAIGNRVDFIVRRNLKQLFDSYNMPFGPRMDVTVNNRDYETSEGGVRYRIPDARLRDIVFDWTLSPKTITVPQIRGFFRADSQPSGVIIIRPSQLGDDSTYLLLRPNDDDSI